MQKMQECAWGIFSYLPKCTCTCIGIDQSEEDLIEELFDRVYANFVEEVDAVDNGIDAFDGTPRYMYVATEAIMHSVGQ